MTNGWEPKYPVKWRDKLYHLSDLTAGIKKAFANRAKLHILTDAAEWMPAAHLVALRGELAAGSEYWTGEDCTTGVALFLGSKAGDIALNRLLFGDSVKDLTDDDLDELIQEKAANPESDYKQAMALIKEEADPKAAGGGPDGTATTASTMNSPATPGDLATSGSTV